MASKISVDNSKCNGCMLCMQVCSLGNYEPGEDGKIQPAEGSECSACGHCVAICPTQAMSHIALPPCEPLDESARPSFEQFLKFLKMRRSIREFKDEPVPKEIIEKLLLAAVEAPSSINNQSVEYTAITDREILKQISDDTYNAPCVILLHASKSDPYAPADAIFNAENILLAAETLGLGACVIGIMIEPMNSNPEIKRLAQLPLDHQVFGIIALGYPRFKYKYSAPKNPPKAKFV